ncbi:MAG: bifunctional methylenetetrahydrofolate dehydrogenase/methenyltetrahydrofolate cyclohydrolase FolD [Planctomycetaceae bacterium]|nr:bifunctional methylenetetrahydrofolate dehydrogenase/methenyltetrahydrofolate cyclohydrolase FolD [Planctomycetaceae bacterium]
MTAQLLDGKTLARTIQTEIAAEVAEFVARKGTKPCLATVLVGADPASEVYIRNKRQACERVGMESRHTSLPAETTQSELLGFVAKLNADPGVHGILVQLPLPKQIDESRVLLAVAPAKDVDCFHPENVGLLVQGRPRFLPCTPHGVQQLLVRNAVDIAGKHVVIVGRSDIVGKPLANMLVQKAAGADATVTVCHSRTRDLAAVTRAADILVAAIGKPRFITPDMVRPGAVVVDVGINRTESGLCGDVDFDAVREVASYITPVPGGVGPLTITMLLKNTLIACQEQVGV